MPVPLNSQGLYHDAVTYPGGNAWSIPWAYTVAGHGNPGNMEDRRDGIKLIFPTDLAKMINNDPNWKGQPIILGAVTRDYRVMDSRHLHNNWLINLVLM